MTISFHKVIPLSVLQELSATEDANQHSSADASQVPSANHHMSPISTGGMPIAQNNARQRSVRMSTHVGMDSSETNLQPSNVFATLAVIAGLESSGSNP